MKTVLLTGGRDPATLELARLFWAAGHRVVVAESMRWPLCRASRAVAKTVRVPPPRQQPAAFIEALITLARQEQVDVIVPTCEETFYVALGQAAMPARSQVFVAPLDTLRVYHSKWAFIQRARQYGLPVPQTRLLREREDVLNVLERGEDIVLKPEYSRFGIETIIRPRTQQEVEHLQLDASRRWVAQAFVEGTSVCTYSVVHEGRITAHSAYHTTVTAGKGAGVVMEPLTHPASYAWVKHFVAQEGCTGQMAFDFIEQEDGTVKALECNPRATSGVHLFHDQPLLAEAFLDPGRDLLVPASSQATMLTVPAILYGVRRVRSVQAFKQGVQLLLTSRDAVFRWKDWKPSLMQLLAIIELFVCHVKYNISMLEATTWDIEWNGEALAMAENQELHPTQR